MAIENQLQAIQSAQAELDAISVAPNGTLFTTEQQPDNSILITARPQLSDSRILQLLLDVAIATVDSITLDDIRANLIKRIKQYIWDKAQSASPDADGQKISIDTVIAQYENDPDIDKGVV